ncbi:SGNH/GDSL hydrolase family protein [Spirillospora sp. NPDC029432]|uniref:SGNH/GDSL hydrolase family protein n=1 Tax=Spirillospora sp. NPDC029432 TaxID=3154599 RepID=UPI0034521C2E
MTSRRARRGAAILALCLASVSATGCGALSGGGAGPRSSPAAAAAKPVTAPAPVVMFLGDSYTVGEAGTLEEHTYASAAARLLGWQVIVAGRSGTGFATGGRAGQAYGLLFESQLGWRPAPDLLIVSGGHNDWDKPPQQVAAAAQDVLDRARKRWPGTRMAFVGPIWGNQSPPPEALAVRDALQGVAKGMSIPFIDPIAGHWITGHRLQGTGNAPRFIKRDGVHPTPEGHRYIAIRLVKDLKRHGLAHPTAG